MLPASVLIRPFRPVVALALAAAVSTTPRVVVAQSLTPTDSALVGRILLAEDRRDSLDAALTEGESHSDARVRALVQRARGRIRDPRLALRDALPPAVPPPAHPEPAWRLRFRALNASRDDCATLRSASTLIKQLRFEFNLLILLIKNCVISTLENFPATRP